MANCPNGPQLVTLFYDSDCGLCRNLAAWVQKGDPNISIRPLTEDPQAMVISQKHESIVLKTASGKYLGGEEAWQLLVELDPRLNRLGWMAERIGLASPRFASALQKAATRVKRWCRSCGTMR